MLPGPDQIIACPHCGGLGKFRTWLSGSSFGEIAWSDGRNFEIKAEGGGTGADPMAFPHDWHRDLLADFLDAIEKNRQPRISGEEALKVHRFIDRLLGSAG